MKDLEEAKKTLLKIGFIRNDLPFPGYKDEKKECYVDNDGLRAYPAGLRSPELWFYWPEKVDHYLSVSHFGENTETRTWTEGDLKKHVEKMKEETRKEEAKRNSASKK